MKNKSTIATPTPSHLALERAITNCGGITEFARRIGISYQAVQNWRKLTTPEGVQRTHSVPLKHVSKVVCIKESKVKPQDFL